MDRDHRPKEQDLLEAETDLQFRQIEMGLAAVEMMEVDLLAINLMLIDHANHFMPDMRSVEESIRRCDRHLGILLERFKPARTVVISDHGSRRVKGQFLLGRWLRQHGYSIWERDDEAESLHANWLAICYWNTHGQRYHPLVEKLRRHWLRRQLTSALGTLKQRAWQRVAQGLDLADSYYWYHATFERDASRVLVGAPYGVFYRGGRWTDQDRVALENDLSTILDPETGERVFACVEWYDGIAESKTPLGLLNYYGSGWALVLGEPPPTIPIRGGFFTPCHNWFGEHDISGILVCSGEGLKENVPIANPGVEDVFPTLLALYGVTSPADVDGRVLAECLTADYSLSTNPVAPSNNDGGSEPSTELSKDEAEEVLARLRALGYVE
jgi:predicted AlkP superfamily phosphohydrolase/phosphomutase